MNSIDSGVKFPDIINYDINNPGSMALYLAHCDFYPFRSVIENNKIALEAISDSYIDIAREANKINDFKRECWAMTSLGLHACRVDLLTQYSLLVTMISLLEEAVNTLCRIYYDVYKIDKKLGEIYVVLDDGEIQEGIVWETAMSAVQFKLDNLIAIINKNGIEFRWKNIENNES